MHMCVSVCVVYARVCENKQVLKQIIFTKPSAAAEMKRLVGGGASWFVFWFNKHHTNTSLWGGYFVMVAHIGRILFWLRCCRLLKRSMDVCAFVSVHHITKSSESMLYYCAIRT